MLYMCVLIHIGNNLCCCADLRFLFWNMADCKSCFEAYITLFRFIYYHWANSQFCLKIPVSFIINRMYRVLLIICAYQFTFHQNLSVQTPSRYNISQYTEEKNIFTNIWYKVIISCFYSYTYLAFIVNFWKNTF